MAWQPLGHSLRGPSGSPGPAAVGIPCRVEVIENPVVGHRRFLWKNTTGAAATITRVVSTVRGAGSPATDFLLSFAPSWDGLGTDVALSGFSCSNTTTGAVVTTFDDPVIPDGNILWIEVAAVLNEPEQLAVQIDF